MTSYPEAPRPTIHWNTPMMQRFKAAYEQAAKDNKESFTFDGHTFVTRYAYYLCQYLETKL